MSGDGGKRKGPAPGRMLRVDGTVLHVLCEGGGPVCVLSGGLGMSWFDWDPVAARLAPHRTVVRFDRPGLGLSAPATGPPTAAGEAARIARVLDALGLYGPCTVVGHSLAAFHAEAFARLHPERAAGLVLVDGSVEEDPRPRLPRTVRTAWAGGLASVLSAAGLPRALGPTARRLTVRASTVRNHPRGPHEAGAYRTSRVLRACAMENATYAYQAAEVATLRPDHPLRGVPVTVLAAYDGSETPRELRWLERQRALATQLGGAFAVAAPAGHLIMADAPDAVATAVLSLTADPDLEGPRGR
ncbi:alpha/beta hydrolase [Streptomyces sp. WAC 06725]|uniref:alpha/beta fold hydrolase n=1 Tax=Streptomyces sp. WAC 06725 TaxID=2203209 RepID=UPI000F744D5B|nr:alpha/beta hydrolase [Streptomyces sp. WAC 06725]RSO50085.1 alpha/beta hydrolase [Streptomyces sp. WAC 06725]